VPCVAILNKQKCLLKKVFFSSSLKNRKVKKNRSCMEFGTSGREEDMERV
jgi:hypothetical protein